MSNLKMTDVISAVKSLFNDNLTINYDFTGYFQDFVAEDYPAICIEPSKDNAALDEGLSWNYDDIDTVTVYYLEEAPEDRDLTTFIGKIESVKSLLKDNPRVNGTFNQGLENIQIDYESRTQEDNIEFIAKITITGRNM